MKCYCSVAMTAFTVTIFSFFLLFSFLGGRAGWGVGGGGGRNE